MVFSLVFARTPHNNITGVPNGDPDQPHVTVKIGGVGTCRMEGRESVELFVEGGGASCRQNFLQLQGVGCAGLEGLEAEGELSLDETHWNSLREQFFRSVLLPVAADRGTRSTIQRHSSCQSVIVQRGALQAGFSLTSLFAVGLRKRSTCSSSHSNT